ncbi:MAG TPA: hypothetical protein EYP40_05950, partial [Chromatiales bacterium]|nr:hypothetical protein [Chromatiales bacterium]
GAGTSEEVVNDNIVALRDELRQLREDSAAAGIDNPELNARLQDLDEELDRMQRAVSISDDELAALQQQLAQLQARTEAPAIVAEEPAIVTEEPVVTEEVTEAAVEVTEAAVGETPDGEQVVAVTETGETVAEPEAAAPAEQAPPETGAGPSPVELAEQIAAQEPAVTTEPEPATPAAEEGVLGMVMGTMKSMGQVLEGIFGSALIVFVGLPVLLVLIIVGLILLKRRSKADKYQESILTGGPASVTGVQEVKESEEESSFLSDFAVSGAGAIQGDDSEVDPLTEADVFIAYGRYEAAEERLKEAIDNDPGRNELKLKLIELYHTTKNKPAFENSAAEFYAALGEGAAENPLWQKVAAMGAELVPGNPLFSGGQPSELPDMAGAADPGVGLSDSQVMDIGLDTGVFGNEELGTTQKPQPAGEPETAAEEGGLDFNLDLGTPASEPETEKESTADLDFSLDTGGAEEPAAGAPAEPSAAGSDFSLNAGGVVAEPEGGAEELSGLDFNLETSDMPQPAVQEEAGSEPDLDLSSASISLADLEEVNTTDDTSEMTMDFDKMAPAEPVPDEPSSQTMAFDMEAGTEADADVGGADEVGTKLDLAKAYIDMGDPDGARSILDEVMDEGNEAQKQEAQQLLQQIA